MQLLSAKLLLQDFRSEIDLFDVDVAEGVDQLCWGMRKIAEPLQGKIAEIGLDATCAYICILKLYTDIDVSIRQHKFEASQTIQHYGRVQ